MLASVVCLRRTHGENVYLWIFKKWYELPYHIFGSKYINLKTQKQLLVTQCILHE
jgi:hypothetical protein